jgi:hypothetical protein
MTEGSTIMIKDTSPDYSKLSERQQDKIGSLQEQNEKLVVENEELLKKLQKQEQQAKKDRFALVELKRNEYSRSRQRQSSSTSAEAMNRNSNIDGNSPVRYESLSIIEQHHLHLSDYIADCWLLNRNSFLKLLPPPEIAGLQTNGGPSMFVDWMNFSVEHLSHLWNVLNVTNVPDPTIFQTAIDHYKHYLETASRSVSLYHSHASSDIHIHSHSDQGGEAGSMKQTIAMIAFQPMTAATNSSETYEKRADFLTAYSLAATIASLYQVGFGRILVVGYRDEDMIGVEGAFRLVESTFKNESTSTNTHTQIHTATMYMKDGTEIAYVRIRDEKWVYTRHMKVNMIRGCIVGMQKALSGQLNDTLTQQWLGNRTTNTNANANATIEYWKYIYLSEPDTILHTKPWILPSIRNQLDKGLSFFPHRIQPLPHESNFPSSHKASSGGMFIPNNVFPFSNITTLDPLDQQHPDSCCDGGDVLPGRTQEYGKGRFPCDGYWWWACGFHNNDTKKVLTKEEVRNRFKRLLEYPMVRFKDGSGLVWGSNERGRRCFPSKTSCPIA